MALSLFQAKTIDSGITSRGDRQNKFRLSRKHHSSGFHIYTLENLARNQSLSIERFLFDRFRATMQGLAQLSDRDLKVTNLKITFKDEPWFSVRSHREAQGQLSIEELRPIGNSTGVIVVDYSALGALVDLLYDARLEHPSDLLDRIIEYHKLFQFTFAEGSESITSDLIVKKNVLSETVRYTPSRQRPAGEMLASSEPGDEEAKARPAKKEKAGEEGLFKSRLAERFSDKKQQVDYEALFGGASDTVSADEISAADKGKKTGSQVSFPLPIMASDIKSCRKTPLRCEFSQEAMQELRSQFLSASNSEFYIGFEILDAIFKSHGKLRSFRFPLYYMRVELSESNRSLFVDLEKERHIYLNHLALANLVEIFSKQQAGQDAIDRFFKTLLAQKVEVNKQLDRIYLRRSLPVGDEYFDKTREILLGYAKENGKGGILGHLKLLGIEADLEGVNLYKIPKIVSTLTQALEKDLNRIDAVAFEEPERFYSSLLGRFLIPEMGHKKRSTQVFCKTPMIPGALPRSTRSLLQKLNSHDLVLLEGPPGTGKTFTIMNLFIHCVASGKRLLVVSDQKAAIHALTEKLDDYLLGRDRDSSRSKQLSLLFQSAVKIVDEVPKPDTPLNEWLRVLRQKLGIDHLQEMDWPTEDDALLKEIQEHDIDVRKIKGQIQAVMGTKCGPKPLEKVSPKYAHDTTNQDIDSLTKLINLLQEEGELEQKFAGILRRFIKHRQFFAQAKLHDCFDQLYIPSNDFAAASKAMQEERQLLAELMHARPRTLNAFLNVVAGRSKTPLRVQLHKLWQKYFPEPSLSLLRGLRAWKALLKHPLRHHLEKYLRVVDNQLDLLSLKGLIADEIFDQIRLMHGALKPTAEEPVPLALEVSQKLLLEDTPPGKQPTVQDLLERLSRVQKKREACIRRLYLSQLGEIARGAFHTAENGGTNPFTTIAAHLEALKAKGSLEAGYPDLKDLQKTLAATFPIWVCRKQAVPFLLPCLEGSFDLVIVDEATQCRVDDALPLLFRAKKLMVVGDEKQTVLAKDSVLDDYLFHEFDLAEHLRSTQAGGIKGGGSHIFGLVKKIKQASVMLDEHYRCPPEIIQFSNRYVYNNELKIMQWSREGEEPSVVVDYSESKVSTSGRRSSGKFKGIETEMVDRFLEYVATTVKRLEKETGKPINMETDVALCYFLLKNEPYIKSVKGEFLGKLGKGSDVLDGAGAALQGKERDYIFFFWDVDRGNMMAFRQGDNEDKRKGELNVLMSRPKKRAFHYLHRNFANLDHGSATITDYLWHAYQEQFEKKQKLSRPTRSSRPGKEYLPWRRSSGAVMEALLKKNVAQSLQNTNFKHKTQCSVAVGDPRHKIDLVIVPDAKEQPAIGLIDLSGFEYNEQCAEEIVDYYMQLQRAKPAIQPIFTFMHEFVDEKNSVHSRIVSALTKIKT